MGEKIVNQRTIREKAVRLAALAIAVCGFASQAPAGQGLILPEGAADACQPAERALIVHNGSVEVLVVQADVKAPEKTKAVQFLPLPSMPEVAVAPEGCFKTLQEIASAADMVYAASLAIAARRGADNAVSVPADPGVEPEAVTVVTCETVADFTKAVSEYFGKNNLGKPAINGQVQKAVEASLKQGLNVFVLDIVPVGPEGPTIRPIVCQFQSDKIFYPLKASESCGDSETRIELLTLLPVGTFGCEQMSIMPNMPKGGRISLTEIQLFRSSSALLQPEDAARLLPAAAAILAEQPSVLRAVKYVGKASFKDEVRALLTDRRGETWYAFCAALAAGDDKALADLTDVPFAFNEEEVVTDKAQLAERFKQCAAGGANPPALHTIYRHSTYMVGYYASSRMSDFDNRFVREHLKAKDDRILSVSLDGEKDVLLFVRGGKIAGFNLSPGGGGTR